MTKAKKRIREELLEYDDGERYEPGGTAPDAYPSQRPRSEIRPPRPTTRGRVLVVDDDALVLSMMERALRRFGFEIITAADGPTGLQIYREEGHAIDLVVLDVNMPNMGGMETCSALYGIDPGVRVIFSSGYDARAAGGTDLPSCVKAFVQKPYRPSEFAELLQGLLDEE